MSTNKITGRRQLSPFSIKTATILFMLASVKSSTPEMSSSLTSTEEVVNLPLVPTSPLHDFRSNLSLYQLLLSVTYGEDERLMKIREKLSIKRGHPQEALNFLSVYG